MLTIRIDEKKEGQRSKTIWYMSIMPELSTIRVVDRISRAVIGNVNRLLMEYHKENKPQKWPDNEK